MTINEALAAVRPLRQRYAELARETAIAEIELDYALRRLRRAMRQENAPLPLVRRVIRWVTRTGGR